MKILIVEELGCVYRLNNRKVVECSYIYDNQIDTLEFFEVDEPLIGQEPVTFRGEELTLSQVYRKVEKILGGV